MRRCNALTKLRNMSSLTPSLTTSENASPAQRSSRIFTEYYAALMLFLIAGFVAGAVLVLRPLLLDIKETNAATEARLQSIDTERAYLASLEQSVAAAEAIPSDALENVVRALPNGTNEPLLLVQFEAAAARHGVRIDSVNFTESKPVVAKAKATASLVQPVEVNLVIRAKSYFDVKRFLADVEGSLRLMDVVGITATSGTGELRFLLQLRTYTFVPTASRTATTSTRP
jgi:hypothetical protein